MVVRVAPSRRPVRLGTAGEACDVLGLSPSGLRWICMTGELPVVGVTRGGRRLFDLDAVEQVRQRRLARGEGGAHGGE